MDFICPKCGKEIEPLENRVVTITVEKEKDGQVKLWTEEARDLKGALLSKRIDSYVYHKSGLINTVNLKSYDKKNNLVSKKLVKHTTIGV